MNPAHSTLEILRDAGLSAEQAEQAASAINQAYVGNQAYTADSNRYGQRLWRICKISAAATIVLTAFAAAVIGVVSLSIHFNPKLAMVAAIGFIGLGYLASSLSYAGNHKTTGVYAAMLDMGSVFALVAASAAATLIIKEVDLWRIVVDSASVGDVATLMALVFVSFLTTGLIFVD